MTPLLLFYSAYVPILKKKVFGWKGKNNSSLFSAKLSEETKIAQFSMNSSSKNNASGEEERREKNSMSMPGLLAKLVMTTDCHHLLLLLSLHNRVEPRTLDRRRMLQGVS